MDAPQEMSPAEIAMTLGEYDTLYKGEMNRLFPLESHWPEPTQQQVETVSKELDALFGPNTSPDFPFFVPSSPRECNQPAQIPVYPELSQTELNRIETGPRLANQRDQNSDFSPQTRYFYPDPSVIVNQNPVGPYFINAAPVQQYQEPEPSVRAYPEHNVFSNQQIPLQNIPWRSQSPLLQPTQFDLNTTTTDDKSQTDLLSQYQSPVKSQNSSWSSFDIGTPSDPPEFKDPPREIVCNEYSPLVSAPVHWDCFEYNRHGELKSGRMYSVGEIERFLFRNPRHFTSHGYSPKLGGLTLWIQRAPHPKKHCHNNFSAVKCRLECCEHAGVISAGQLRVAFDEQTRLFPNHNPLHNAGYVHLSCLERFLDFPRICTELIVKGEDRVLAYDGRKRNSMILRTVQEVDIVDRFAKFCSANRRAPTSYPTMNMRKRTRPFQGTLVQELNVLGPAHYRDHLQMIWETQGRSAVTAECKRKEELELQKLQKRKKHANVAVQRKEPAKKRKRQAREPETETEFESEFESKLDSAQDDHCELKRKGRKRARISEHKLNVKPVPKKRVKKDLQTRKAKHKLSSQRRNINPTWDGEFSAGSEMTPTPTSSFEHKHGGQKRAQERRSRPRGEPPPDNRGDNDNSNNTNHHYYTGEKSRKRPWMPEPESGPKPSTPSNIRAFMYRRRAYRQAKKPELLRLPNRKSEWTVNGEEGELPPPKKRARSC